MKTLPLWPGAHLTEDNLCGIAEEIVKDPTWKISPAFGAGCCRPLFNEARERILRERAILASGGS